MNDTTLNTHDAGEQDAKDNLDGPNEESLLSSNDGESEGYNLDEDARSLEQAKEDHLISRRNMLRGIGAAGATAAVGGVSSQYPELSPVGEADALVGLAVVAGAGVLAIAGGAQAVQAYKNMQANSQVSDGATSSEIHQSIYNDASLVERDIVQELDFAQDELDQTAALSRAEAKYRAYMAISNGASETDAQSEATSIINEYYAGVEEAFFRAQESSILQMEQYVTDINNTSGLAVGDVLASQVYSDGPSAPYSTFTFGDVEVELSDGRTITLRKATGDNGNPRDLYFYGSSHTTNSIKGKVVVGGPSPDYKSAVIGVAKEVTESNHDGDRVFTSWEVIASEIETQRSNAQSDVSSIISNVFANYTQEQLSEIDQFVSPIGRMLTSSENYFDTGAPAYQNSAAYELGIPTTAAGTSLTVEYEPRTDNGGTAGDPSDDTYGSVQTFEGTLYGWSPSSGEISTGTTHDTANISDPVYMQNVQDSGQVEQIKLDGRFTVTEIRDGEGNTQPNVPTYDPTLTTPDTSNLVDQFLAALEARDEQEQAEPNNGGGGGSGNAVRNLGIVGLAISAVYALVRNSRDNGN